MSKFERFCCWTADNVRRTAFSDLGALSIAADPLVLAARVRTELFLGEPDADREDPIHLEEVAEHFRASLDDASRNTIAAVVGPSGCGKTFVVRWIHAQLADLPNAHVVYVPRDRTSLRQVLRMVLSLPGAAAEEQLRLLGQASEDLPVELQRKSLVHEMSIILSTKDRIAAQDRLQEQLLGEFDEKARVYRRGLGDLLASDAIADHMVQQGLTASRLVDRNNGNHLDDESPSQFDFSVGDLPASVPNSLRSDLSRVFNLVGTKAGQIAAAGLLNAARDQALIRLAGIHTDLSEVFSDARLALAEAGKQLVLIFEDIAVSGGVEAQLYNLFTSQPTDGRCPIRVFFAATKGHYDDRVPRTVQTRVAPYYRMRNPNVTERAGLEFAERMTANYFSISRLGPDRVIDAWSSATPGERDAGRWIPNACDVCDHREQCHDEFGAVEGVGLYPLNSRAVHFAARKAQRDNERERGGEGFTPRQLVQRLVEELLPEAAAHLVQGSFPHVHLDQVFSPDPIPLQEILADLVAAGTLTDLNSSEAKRVARARAIWSGRAAHSVTFAHAFSLPTGEVAATCRFGGCTSAPISDGLCAQHQPETALCGEVGCAKLVVRDGRCADHAAVVALVGEWPPPELTAWAREGGSKLDPLVDQLRDFLTRTVQAAVEMALDFRPGAKHIVDAYVKDRGFQFANSLGDQRAQNVLERRFLQHPDELPMLTAALWFRNFETWERRAETQNRVLYQLPEWAAVGGRLQFEQWIDDCRDEVVAHVEQTVGSAVSSAVRVRALMVSALGRGTMTGADLANLGAVSELSIPRENFTMARTLIDAMSSALEASTTVLKDYASVRKGSGGVAAIDSTALLAALAELQVRAPSTIDDYRPVGLDADVFAAFISAANELADVMLDEARETRGRLRGAAVELEALGADLEEVPRLSKSVNDDLEALMISVPHWPFDVAAARQTLSFLRRLDMSRMSKLCAAGDSERLARLDDVSTLRSGFEFADAGQVAESLILLKKIVTEMLDLVETRHRALGRIDAVATRAHARQMVDALVRVVGGES